MNPSNEHKKIILLGAGLRGQTYTDKMADMDGAFRVVAVAEPIADRRAYIREKHGIPDADCTESWEPLMERPKFADAVVIATMDRGHYEPAMAAIRRGYDILLEKPMSARPDECMKIAQAAKAAGVHVLVCHVLRYTAFFRALKAIIDSGRIGDVVHIQHAECVGNVHQSHSFVRGNWKNSEESSCMILQKSCHDMDILQWLIGKPCRRVQSFGGLYYFREENAPAGAPERCTDGCPVGDTCPYNAVKLYLEDRKNDWFRTSATHRVHPTDADVEQALRTTEYGRCVFRCSNNVVDHQTVNLEFAGGATVSFTMCAFNQGERAIRIMGTRGELRAEMGNPVIDCYDFATRQTGQLPVDNMVRDQSIVGGHGGGDAGIVRVFSDVLHGDTSGICDITETCENHMIAFAAEASRITGRVIDMEEFDTQVLSGVPV